ncbi:MAG: tRNA 2-selenouridine(34) synthase MnmH [Cyanobacteria bacterium J083]|nr:MAG: tRNA 2-selenouridine(34) synthase MnmH [Cyanobacteria bacterium J083]
MPKPEIRYTQNPWQNQYSEIIDVRSPTEYAEDHIPSAINLPVLDDLERAKVGTIYKQVSNFTARKVGAALIAKKVAYYLETHFADKDTQYTPLIYCWRGGQRSGSLAMLLQQIGWRVTVLVGGYKTYRRYVREQLEKLPGKFDYKILCGLTGTGKTAILRQLKEKNAQVLDLEAIANHRGSLLGQEWQLKQFTTQPSQKWFESLLLKQLQKFNPQQPVWVESESNKIGEVYLPSSLWQKFQKSTCLEIKLPLAARINWLLATYPHLAQQGELLKQKLSHLKARYGHKTLKRWYELIDNQQGYDFIQDILLNHYDPAYQKSLQRTYQPVKKIIELANLSPESINQAVDILLENSAER